MDAEALQRQWLLTGIRRRAQSTRSLQSSTEDRRDAQRIFPTTLRSGRPAQHNTISQQLYYQHLSRRDAAYEVSLQAQRDREYEASLQRAQHGREVADRRFFKHVNTTDYTEIKDPDPYADIFGESGGTQRLRTAAWQRQFEAENAHVELPYERTNVLSRLAPNWFVRFFVNMRDCGGATDATGLVVVAVITLSLMWWVTWMFYTAPSRSRPTHEIR